MPVPQPAFEGDVTYLDGEVVEKIDQSPFGCRSPGEGQESTQDGDVILSGTAEVELPH